MFSHAPAGYACPFCFIVGECREGRGAEHAVVHHDELLTALVPRHHYAGIRGNVLLIPNAHYEGIFDIDCGLGSPLLHLTQRIAVAMKRAYGCEGISTRQHNEPAGNQDVWHYHLHVFPRYPDDNLYGGHAARYETEERLQHAARLREHLGPGGPVQ